MSRAQTPQEQNWGGPKGVKYANRFFFEPDAIDKQWKLLTGKHTRRQMNKRFVGSLPRGASILEVGCNVGNQLAALRSMGFTDLHGIELHPHAVEIANQRRPWADIRQCSALDFDGAPDSFDMVMTTWALTHIAPEHLEDAMLRAGRCARAWIWGCEPWWPEGIALHQADSRTGHGYLWKGDYAGLWMKVLPAFRKIKTRRYEWVNRKTPGPELDVEMFLLERRRKP